MKLVSDWKQAHQWASVRIASGGALLGAVAAGLAASGAASQWVGLLPVWAVFGLGALICLLIIAARLWDQAPADESDKAGA
jgi:asparagine N-glycosylation enzyme membrane subunit Stt3